MTEAGNRSWMSPALASHHGSIPVARVVAESSMAMIILERILAYKEGCVLHYTAAARRAHNDAADGPSKREELRALFEPGAGGGAPSFRIRLPDGRTANTEDGARLHITATNSPGSPQPKPPVLLVMTGSAAAGDRKVVELHQPLWLWPLPPPERFIMLIDWPKYEITEAGHELDGGEIVEASAVARPFWTDDA